MEVGGGRGAELGGARAIVPAKRAISDSTVGDVPTGNSVIKLL
ncbi:hypothetical protein A2U01_0057304, partial [Trifolium medium]|nr:hypothetical protein [Trifolium medium]